MFSYNFQSKPASISMEQVSFTPTVHWDALSQKAAKGTPFSIDAPYIWALPK